MVRSMYGPDQLLLASKKPRIKELVAKIPYLTVEEIKNLPEKSDIIRGLLLIKDFGIDKATVHQQIADKMIEKHPINLTVEFEACNIYQLSITEPMWARVGATMLEVNPGDYFGVLNDGKCIIKNIVLPPQPNFLLYCNFIQSGNVQDLKDIEYRRMQKLIA
jgi:hypothetical protein